MPKTRINVSLDQDIADFIKVFASENRTTVADVVTQYLLTLKRKVEGRSAEVILSDPVFHAAMKDALARLQKGTAVWHTYEEVFGD
jgi:hypothetical protein